MTPNESLPYHRFIKRMLLGVVSALGVLLFVLLSNRDALGVSCVNNMDRAYTHLSVAMAEREEFFEGAFSHAGFRHPGPSLFYFLALASRLLGKFTSRETSFHLAMAFLNSFFIGLSIFLLSGLMRRMAYGLVLAPISLAVLSPKLLFDYWNPAATPAATIAYLVSLAYLAYGRCNILPLVVSLGSFIVQCHIGAVPFVCIAFLYAVLFCFWKHHWMSSKHGNYRIALLLSLLFGFVFWRGPVADLAYYGSESNLFRIAVSFLDRHETPNVVQAFFTVWGMAAKKLCFSLSLPEIGRRLLPALLGISLFFLPSRGCALFHLRNLIAIGWICSVWALTQSFQPLAGYLIRYFLGVLSLTGAVVAQYPLRRVASLVMRTSGRSAVLAKSGKLAFILGAAIVLRFYVRPSAVPPVSKGCPRAESAEQFVTAMNVDSNVLYEISPLSFSLRDFSVFFALELINRRANFCFIDSWRHYVGRALTCSYQRTSAASLQRVLVELSTKERAPSSEGKPEHNDGKAIVVQRRFQGGPVDTFEAVWHR